MAVVWRRVALGLYAWVLWVLVVVVPDAGEVERLVGILDGDDKA